MIEIKELKKKIPMCPFQMDVTLNIPKGEIVCLFGENGSGKSTLMKCILGLTSCKGEVLLDGEPITHNNIGKISFATNEHSYFPNLSADDHKEFYKKHFPGFREDRYKVLMEFFNLYYGVPLRKMSTGQQNQVEVILALCQGADYIFLDEPFVGSDLFNREDFYKLLLGLLDENETIFLSTHLVEEVEHFIGRAFLIKEGKIIGETTIDELEESGKTLTDYVKEHYGYSSDRVVDALKKLEQ